MRLPLLDIPASPGKFLLDVGPFHVRWYGFLIAIGVILAIYIARHELRRRGLDPEIAWPVAAWTVPAGIIGARVYHVVTDWSRFSDNLSGIPKLWEGGLGMPGVIVGGAIGAAIGARRAGVGALTMFDCVIPGVLAAQVLGRWGNYFNQELFGGPTSLPWGLKVDERYRPDAYAADTTFHPTFLYESLANLCCSGCSTGSSATTSGGWSRGRSSPPTSSATASCASGSRACASTPPTSSGGCGSTSGCSWSSSCSPAPS